MAMVPYEGDLVDAPAPQGKLVPYTGELVDASPKKGLIASNYASANPELDDGQSEGTPVTTTQAPKNPGSVMAGYVSPAADADTGVPLSSGLGPQRADFAAQTAAAVKSLPLDAQKRVAAGNDQAGKVARSILPASEARAKRLLQGAQPAVPLEDVLAPAQDDASLDAGVSLQTPLGTSQDTVQNPGVRDIVSDWWRAKFGDQSVAEERQGRHEAEAHAILIGRAPGLTDDQAFAASQNAVRGSNAAQFAAQKLLDSATFGIIAPTTPITPHTTTESISGAAGYFAGFMAGPAKGAAGLVNGLEHVAGESFLKATAKDVINQGAELALANVLKDSGHVAFDQHSAGDAGRIMADAIASGAEMGATFGTVARFVPGPGVMAFVARATANNLASDISSGKPSATLDTLADIAGGRNTPDLGNRVFNILLNTVFSRHGAGKVDGGWVHDNPQAGALRDLDNHINSTEFSDASTDAQARSNLSRGVVPTLDSAPEKVPSPYVLPAGEIAHAQENLNNAITGVHTTDGIAPALKAEQDATDVAASQAADDMVQRAQSATLEQQLAELQARKNGAPADAVSEMQAIRPLAKDPVPVVEESAKPAVADATHTAELPLVAGPYSGIKMAMIAKAYRGDGYEVVPVGDGFGVQKVIADGGEETPSPAEKPLVAGPYTTQKAAENALKFKGVNHEVVHTQGGYGVVRSDPAPASTHGVVGMPIQEIPLGSLSLSKDVPQFKLGADKDGAVEKLGTKVATRIVVLDKSDKAPQQSQADYSRETDIHALFDRMESLTVPPRAKAVEMIHEAPLEPILRATVPQMDAGSAKAAADGMGLPIVEHTTQAGKVLRGVVRTDLDKAQAKEIDPYTFPKAGGFFIREKHLEAMAGKGGVEFNSLPDDAYQRKSSELPLEEKTPPPGGVSASDPQFSRREIEDIPPDELKGRDVDVPVHIEDTGETGTMTLDARHALDDYAKREDTFSRLLECIA